MELGIFIGKLVLLQATSFLISKQHFSFSEFTIGKQRCLRVSMVYTIKHWINWMITIYDLSQKSKSQMELQTLYSNSNLSHYVQRNKLSNLSTWPFQSFSPDRQQLGEKNLSISTIWFFFRVINKSLFPRHHYDFTCFQSTYFEGIS